MKMNKAVAALALSLSILCVPAHGQKVEYPVDVYMVSNANIFLSADPTNPLENRLDYLEGLGQSSQGVTNQNLLLTDGSRVAQTFKIWNSNSLSAELLSNPDFSGSADQWSLTNGTYASDAIFITSGATAYLSYTGAVDIDLYATYQLSFDLIGTGPVATISARAGGITNALSAVGTGATRVAFTVLTATSGPSLVITTTNSITVDNLSIKRITGGDAVDAGNRTIGGDLRVRGQVSGATNLATAADLATETAARIAADASVNTNETTDRIAADQALSNSIAALLIRNSKLGLYYESAPTLLTNGVFGAGATSSWIRQGGSASDVSLTNGFFGATNSAGGGGSAVYRQSISLASGSLYQVYLSISQFSGQFASVTVPGITATNAGLFVSNYLPNASGPFDLYANQSCENCGTGYVQIARVDVWPISTNNVLSFEYFDGSLWYSSNRMTWKRISVISTNL